MKKIIHIVQFDEKFIKNYYSFFQKNETGYQHIFFIINRDNAANYIKKYLNNNNIYLIDSIRIILLLKKEIKNSYRIIISGLFSSRIPFLIPFYYWKKTILHFWGGDYTRYKETSIISKLRKVLIKPLIRKSYCILNLIDGEYDVFKKIFKFTKKHYVASFPYVLETIRDYDRIKKENPIIKHRIIIGNSATYTNYHIEVFNMLKRFAENDIEIHCPLSYGESDYRDKVIQEGKKIFGEKFIPHTEFISKNEYINFLATSEIGIFNNDRQQALGNINEFIRLGKKVFIRNDTPMWEYFRQKGITVYDVTELNTITFESLFLFNSAIGDVNSINNSQEKNYMNMKKQWELVLNS